jgi:hypothetical protein
VAYIAGKPDGEREGGMDKTSAITVKLNTSVIYDGGWFRCSGSGNILLPVGKVFVL